MTVIGVDVQTGEITRDDQIQISIGVDVDKRAGVGSAESLVF